MSTETVEISLGTRRRSWITDLRTARVLRYGFGVTAAMAIAFGYQWPLFFLTPLLAAVFLSLPLPAPTLVQTIRNIGYVAVAFALGLLFTLVLFPYPLVYTTVLGVVLFHIYYLANRGGSVWLVLMSLIAVVILPMVGNTQDAVPVLFALYFALSSTLAVLIGVLAHGLFSDPDQTDRAPQRPPYNPDYAPQAARTALESTLVSLPLITLFIALNWTDQVLVAVYAAIFSLNPALSRGKASGVKALISTMLGGLIAMVSFFLLIAVPEFHFFIVLMLPIFLLLGAGIFSTHASAKYLGSAATALIVLLGSVMDAEASIADEFFVRVLLIGAATLYIVVALSVLDHLRPGSAGAP